MSSPRDASPELGYLEARKEPGKTHNRAVYTLTEKGLEALARMGADGRRLGAKVRLLWCAC